MARRRAIKRKILLPDPIYQNPLIEMITNHLMRKGKKLLAYRICYSSMKDVGEITQKDPVAVVEQAIRNVTPLVEVKAKRRGGGNLSSSCTSSAREGNCISNPMDHFFLPGTLRTDNGLKTYK